MIRVRVIFKGRVQGVFFRANCKRKALELGVNGWVKNLSDGSVASCIEGDEESVNELVRWCRSEQPMAKVSRSEVISEEFKGEFDGFRIIY